MFGNGEIKSKPRISFGLDVYAYHAAADESINNKATIRRKSKLALKFA